MTIFDGEARQLAYSTPLSQVVNIDIERQSLVQTMHKSPVHASAHLVVRRTVAAFHRIKRANDVVATGIFVWIHNVVL